MTLRMPVLFFGHGSPMNIVAQNPYTQFLADFGPKLRHPKAIVCVSAHWQTRGTRVLRVEHPRTIHDFFGFPDALYAKAYPAPGSLAVADRVLELLGNDACWDAQWGLDHGSWSLLLHLFPAAKVPVLQISMDHSLSVAEHFQLAQKLRPLREEEVLFVASGNITHNLRLMDWQEDAPVPSWAKDFDEFVAGALLRRDLDVLLHPDLGARWTQAHPHLDHYLPLTYALGMSDPNDLVQFPFVGFQNASLSMRAVQWGSLPSVATSP